MSVPSGQHGPTLGALISPEAMAMHTFSRFFAYSEVPVEPLAQLIHVALSGHVQQPLELRHEVHHPDHDLQVVASGLDHLQYPGVDPRGDSPLFRGDGHGIVPALRASSILCMTMECTTGAPFTIARSFGTSHIHRTQSPPMLEKR